MKIVFFGTPEFAAEVLRVLIQNGYPISAVITRPDRAKGRSGTPSFTPVKRDALSQNPPIPVFQPESVSAPEFAPVLQALEADLFIVVAFGEIIKQHLLDMPKLGCVNIHASLLPKYRGAAPIQQAIINGEKETGVSIMYMVRKMDAGDVIDTVSIPIPTEMTYGELEKELCQKGSQLLLKVLNDFKNNSIHRFPQDHSLATYAPKIELEDCLIQWNWPAEKIHNLVRGVNPHPGAWCNVEIRGETKRLKFIRTALKEQSGREPGELLPGSNKELIVSCGVDALQLLEVQLEGKKSLSTEEFLRGFSKETIKFL